MGCVGAISAGWAWVGPIGCDRAARVGMLGPRHGVRLDHRVTLEAHRRDFSAFYDGAVGRQGRGITRLISAEARACRPGGVGIGCDRAAAIERPGRARGMDSSGRAGPWDRQKKRAPVGAPDYAVRAGGGRAFIRSPRIVNASIRTSCAPVSALCLAIASASIEFHTSALEWFTQ